MIDIKVHAAKGQFFDRAAIADGMSKTERRGLSKFGAFVRRRMRSSIRKRKKISQPGQPPSSHAGHLRQFIFFVFDKTTRSVVIGPAMLNKPGLTPKLLEEGGEVPAPPSRFGNKNQAKALTYRPRPFAQPALQAELPNAPKAFAGTFKK